MGLFSSGGGNQMNGAYEKATKAIGFNPIDLQLSGIGSTDFTYDKNKGLTSANMTQDPGVLALQNLLMGGASPAVAAGQAGIPGIGDAAGQLLGAGQGFLGQLGSYDPQQVAADRYAQLQAIMAPQRAREQSSAESRLLAQGRLDSSGGALQLEGLRNAQLSQDAQLADRQFTEAQAAQIAMANLGQNLTGAGAGMYGSLLGTGLQQAQGAQGLNAPLLNLLQLSAGLGTSNLAGLQARQSAIGGYNAQQAQDGGGFMSNLLPAIATGAGAAFGGPMGAAAGASLGSLFSGGGSTATPMSSAPLAAPSTNGQFALGNLLGYTSGGY
jgi:hypothetical protein